MSQSQDDSTPNAASLNDALAVWRARLVPFFIVVLSVSILLVVACLILSFIIITSPPSYAEESKDVLVLVTLLHVSLGMMLGLSCLAFGVAMTWVGIEAPFRLDANSSNNGVIPFSMALQSVGPGIALLIGGMLLMYGSLTLPIQAEYSMQSQSKTAGKIKRPEGGLHFEEPEFEAD